MTDPSHVEHVPVGRRALARREPEPVVPDEARTAVHVQHGAGDERVADRVRHRAHHVVRRPHPGPLTTAFLDTLARCAGAGGG
ncbi:hypothetical protein [Streptomyces sp. NPDC059761]|uniref:hypothetical protein n=1 Tax=Streptomyces sp. NPDC059761 TaxID=3346937 RepID=UPI00364DD255